MEARLAPQSPDLASGKGSSSDPPSSAFGYGKWRLPKLRAAALEPSRRLCRVVWVWSRQRRSRKTRKRFGEVTSLKESKQGSRSACLGCDVVKSRRRSRGSIDLSGVKTTVKNGVGSFGGLTVLSSGDRVRRWFVVLWRRFVADTVRSRQGQRFGVLTVRIHPRVSPF
ncbi:Uncharacterized protein Rs2_49851 [Raphanus sativus]|nr:Uncharacterized protein Rs2_49851 [Raphanus sativus]